MRNQEFEITSYWQYEKGRWSEKENAFVDRNFSEVQEKTLQVIYEPDENIIRFVGGPTGYESYYFSDIIRTLQSDSQDSLQHENFCICGGTINRWANCTVKMKDFQEIVNQIKKRKTEEN